MSSIGRVISLAFLKSSERISAFSTSGSLITNWASLSDEELAEAGYTREDVESGALEQNIEGVASGTDAEPVVATFTDASSGAEIVSSDIDSKYMMFITDQKTAVKFDDGNVLYYTGNASRGRTDKEVICNGEGKTVIVFEFNYAY